MRSHIRGNNIHVRAYCRSNPKGYKKWHYLLKTGRPTAWPLKKEKSVPWKTNEITRVIHAEKALPSWIDRAFIRGIFRMDRSVHYPNPAANLLGNITLYDQAFSKSENLSRTLVHESAHFVFDDLSDDDKQSYLDKTGWKNVGILKNNRWIGRSDGYVEPDGCLTPDEDFSNNLEYYLYEEQKLKKTTPMAHEWFKSFINNQRKK